MKRKERYGKKLDYIFYKISNLPLNPLNEITIDAMLYRIQTSTEAAMDVIAMLCKDLGIPVSDDYSNIAELSAKKIISDDLAEDLKRLNGLRNAIVHRYNKLNYQEVIKNINEIKRILLNFIEVVEDLLREIFGENKG
ncbi:MAG: type VII toxin-antitoxin system HepT family RNase toxin [Candidatus Asgardarchaeia archaeon]